MDEKEKTICGQLLEVIKDQVKATIGITSSPSTTLDITIDITEESKAERALGQMVYVVIEEDGRDVLVMGQIISIRTENRWHQDPSFKGVIKRHGRLPHLSGTADNRIATISVQACYDLGKAKPEGYILGTSPSTGERVKKMNNDVMKALMKHHEGDITYMGKVYGTPVDLPFWFKHFDKTDEKNDELGAGDAYHIGVFGQTGSGKTVTATYMLLGYAKNKHNINILVLDPKGQFYIDTELLPKEKKLKDAIEKIGMKYYKYRVLEDLYLPADAYELFGSLLQKSGFIKNSFNILSERETNAADAISVYMQSLARHKNKYANLKRLWDDNISFRLMELTLKAFTETEEITNRRGRADTRYNNYINMVYSQPARKEQLIDTLNSLLGNKDQMNEIYAKYWKPVANLFAEKRSGGRSDKSSIESIIDSVTTENNKGNFVILDMSGKGGRELSENLQAMFVKIIETKIKTRGEKFYEKGNKVNCLIVMDEAHRFISRESSDFQITELTSEIIDSVRTTRKYGIGYMFITQTIESLDREIWDQIKILAFGYGLTSGPALKRISDKVNNNSAISLYRSFIDPASNNKFPFMFYGPISPLSFTGSPLFIEVYSDPSVFK